MIRKKYLLLVILILAFFTGWNYTGAQALTSDEIDVLVIQ